MREYDDTPDRRTTESDSSSRTIHILYLDDDPSARMTLESLVSERSDLALITESELADDAQRTPPSPVDAIVASPAGLSREPHLVSTADRPIVLYADEDPADIDEHTLDRADSLVQKGADDSAAFLVEKVLGIVNNQTETESGPQTVSDHLVADLTDAGVFAVDESGRVKWSTSSFQDLFEVAAESPAAAGAGDFYARLATLVTATDDAMSELLSLRGSTETRRCKHLLVSADDTERQYLHISRPLSAGAAGERAEMFVDVTTVVDRYETLTQFEELVENAEDGLFVLNADGCIEYCNQSYAQMLGYNKADLLGEHSSQLMASGEIEKGQDLLSDLIERGEGSAVIDLRLETRTGETLLASVNFSVRHTEDGYDGILGVLRDITERKRRERTLEQYRTLVESAADPMYVLDENGDIQILNRAMATFLGRERTALVGQNITQLLPTDDLEEGRRALKEILSTAGKDSESFEALLTDADGNERLFEVTVSAVTEADTFEGSVATFRDVTERHRREEELALRKEVFARSLRHNIRNETSVIHSYSSLLAEELDGAQAEMAESILEASQTLAKTSRKVNEFDWLAEKDTTRVHHELFPLVKQCVEQVRATNPAAAVTIDVPADVHVSAIHDIDIAIRNLVENALQHGTDESPPTVDIIAHVDEESVTLTVADDGPGIPPEEIEVVDKGRETPLQHVSGLGLWLVKHVVVKSGGTLTFAVEDGTTVEMSLDRARSDD